MSIYRNTGGNQFIPHDATREDLMEQIEKGLDALEKWTEGTDHLLDLGAITIYTNYVDDGSISVNVQADLDNDESRAYRKNLEEQEKK